jgi:hypothetical protein
MQRRKKASVLLSVLVMQTFSVTIGLAFFLFLAFCACTHDTIVGQPYSFECVHVPRSFLRYQVEVCAVLSVCGCKKCCNPCEIIFMRVDVNLTIFFLTKYLQFKFYWKPQKVNCTMPDEIWSSDGLTRTQP